jgi:hypothetical protein
LNLETTDRYPSFLNGKVKHTPHTLAVHARCMLINTAADLVDWCYVMEHIADVYRVTINYAFECSPLQDWYDIVPNAKYMHIWGCNALTPHRNLKKGDPLTKDGMFYGFFKGRILLRWFDPSTKIVQHAYGDRFLEFDPLQASPSIGQNF